MDPEEPTDNGIIDNAGLNDNSDVAGRELNGLEEGDQTGQDTLDNGQQTTIDEDALAEKIAQRWETRQSQQLQPEKQYTPAELDEIFKVWKPSPDLVTALREGDVEKAVEQIIGMRDGMQKQFSTVMTMTIQAELQKLRQEFGGVQAESERLAAQRSEQEFYKSNPDLNQKDAKHTRAARLAYNAVALSGIRFKDVVTASKAVADETRAILKDMGVSLTPRNGGGASTQTRMQTLARGGSGAARSGGSSATSGVSQALRELA